MTGRHARTVQALDWSVASRQQMPPGVYDDILALCTRAYEEDAAALIATLHGCVHVIGSRGGRAVSHALWVTRWLQVGSSAPLRTAFVEMVATDPEHRRCGHASEAMRRIAAEVKAFDLAALSPFNAGWYARLGWEQWRGPLFIRTGGGLMPTPGEEVMILRLPRTPPLDLDAPLSAEWREGELW